MIITDQIKYKVPTEMQDHFIDDLLKIKEADVIVNNLDDYEVARCNIKPINKSSHNFGIEDQKYSNNGSPKFFFQHEHHGNSDNDETDELDESLPKPWKLPQPIYQFSVMEKKEITIPLQPKINLTLTIWKD